MYTCTAEDRLSLDPSQVIGSPKNPLMKSNSNQQRITTKRGWLRNGNVPGDLSNARPCGARTRSGGECRAPAMSNGRCRMHEGASTGPRTREGPTLEACALEAWILFGGSASSTPAHSRSGQGESGVS